MHTCPTLFSSIDAAFKPVGLRLVVSLLVFTPIFVQHAAAQGQIPETIAYQGYLTNTDGDPANGATSVTFSLYDDDVDGARLWQETQPGVVFTDGVFSAQLGAVEPLAGVSFDRPLWLEVDVAVGEGGRVTLRPRVALDAVPYAMSLRHLRVVPSTSQVAPSPNLIGGHVENDITDELSGATIGGGGVAGAPNVVTADFGTVGGGVDNQAGSIATVGGGSGNRAGARATVAGGSSNVAGGDRSTIGGGISNAASGERSTVGGGANNTASGERGTVGGGENNTADRYATVGGGQVNNATGFSATVGGGAANLASGDYTTVAGGESNEATGNHAFVGGGQSNRAEGINSMVPGGFQNHATRGFSFAAGYNARAVHTSAFVWADLGGGPGAFSSTAPDQFLIRAIGGVGIGTNAPRGAMHLTETDIGLDPEDVTDDALIVEGNAPVITLYGNFQQNTRPGLVLAGVENGNVGDKWGIVREYFGFNALHFTYGLNQDHTQNATAMSLRSDGPRADAFHATEDLGANGTPSQGGHYRDNVVYAWAHVNGDGTVTASYGCTVTRQGLGRYRVDYHRALPNGMAPVVTPLSANDPVIATVSPSGTDGATVVVFNFAGGQFQAGDRPFYIQVVGRP